jgi:aspartate aminotransferase-like enzyme
MRVEHSPTGFASRPNQRLRARILIALSRCETLSTAELAASVYGERLILRRGWHRTAPSAQLSATRRALRRLAREGLVVVAAVQRRRKVFASVGNRIKPIDLGSPLHV